MGISFRARWQDGLVLTALLLSAALSWHNIRTTSIWYDEAITLMTLAGHAHPIWTPGAQPFQGDASFGRILSDLYTYDVHPPLYFWAASAWKTMAGGSIEGIRWLSALFILASIWLFYRTALTFPLQYAAFATCVYAFSGAAAGYAYTARPYAMAEFLIVLTIFLCQRKSGWAGLAAAAAVGTHYFAALCVGPILLYYCIEQWNTGRRWTVHAALSFTGASLLLTPLLLVHFGARPEQYAGVTSLIRELKAAMRGALACAVPNSKLGWLLNLTLVAVAIALAAGMVRSFLGGCRMPAFAWILFSAGFFLLEILTGKPIANMPVAYYWGFTAPLAALLIALGLDGVRPAIAVFAAIAGLAVLTGQRGIVPHGDARATVARIGQDCRDCIVAVGAGSGRGIPGSLLYEARGLPVVVLEGSSIPAELVDRARNAGKVYLIPSNEKATISLEQEFVRLLGMRADGRNFVRERGN